MAMMMVVMMTFFVMMRITIFFLNSILVMKSYNIQKFACKAPVYSIFSGLLALRQHVMGNIRNFASITQVVSLLSLCQI
jgi:hypothetical protein